MTRETRLNLWFLAIFLIISLPGAVILFIKKLDPSASRIDEPDAVRMQLPYMAPVPAPPETRWMVPPVTLRWLRDLTQQKTGGPMASTVPPGPEWEPVISPDHRLQVMSVRSAGGTTHLALTVWDTPLSDDASRINPRFQADGNELPASIVRNDSVEIPGPIRYELVNMGFSHPPARIEWIDCDVKGPIEPNDHVTLTLVGAKAPVAQSSVSWTVR